MHILHDVLNPKTKNLYRFGCAIHEQNNFGRNLRISDKSNIKLSFGIQIQSNTLWKLTLNNLKKFPAQLCLYTVIIDVANNKIYDCGIYRYRLKAISQFLGVVETY